MTPKYIEELEVTGTTDSSISLGWEVVDNAEGYKVYRANNVYSEASVIATVTGADNTTYKDTSVTKDSSYYYYIIPFSAEVVDDFGEKFTFTSMDYLEYDGIYYHYTNGVTATAKQKEFSVDVITMGDGTATVDYTTQKPGYLVTLTITPDPGFKVKSKSAVTKGGVELEIKDNSVFTMPEDDVTVTVNFEQEIYSYRISWFPATAAEIEGAPTHRDDMVYGDEFQFAVNILDDRFELDCVIANNVELKPDEYGTYNVTQPAADLIITVVLNPKDAPPVPDDGWFTDDAGNKRYIKDGEPLKGKQKIEGKTYYFNKNTGVMVTGWKTLSGKRYYFKPSTGEMYTGLKTISKKKYYFDSKGVMQSGWQTISKKKYYFKLDSKGEYAPAYMDVGKKIGSYYYLFNADGVMQKSGVKSDSKGNTYYLKSTGKAYTKKWYKKKGKSYYFGTNGKMVKGTSLKIGKKTYKFDKKGVCKNP